MYFYFVHFWFHWEMRSWNSVWQVLQDRTHNMVELCRVVRNDWTLCSNTYSQVQNVAWNLCSPTFWCLHNLNVWLSQTIQPRPSLGFTKAEIQQLGIFSAALSFLLEHAGPDVSFLKLLGRINVFFFFFIKGGAIMLVLRNINPF